RAREPCAEGLHGLLFDRRRLRHLPTSSCSWPAECTTYTPAVPYDVLSDEQREIRELVRTLARERIAPRAAEIDKKAEFPWDLVELFREHELFGIMFDEQYGGHGANALTTLVAV